VIKTNINIGSVSSIYVFDDGAVFLRSVLWILSVVHRQRLARSIGPNRLGSSDDEGRAIPRNVVITKHRDDG
jgi:hypothetical protein